MWKKISLCLVAFILFLGLTTAAEADNHPYCTGYGYKREELYLCSPSNCNPGIPGGDCSCGNQIVTYYAYDCRPAGTGTCVLGGGHGGYIDVCSWIGPPDDGGGGGGGEEPGPTCDEGDTTELQRYDECGPFDEDDDESCKVKKFQYNDPDCPSGDQFEIVSCQTCPNGCSGGVCVQNTPTATPTPAPNCLPDPNSCGAPYCETWEGTCNGTNYFKSQECTDTCGQTYYNKSCSTGEANCPAPTSAPTTTPPPGCGGLPTCGTGQHAIGPGQTCTLNSQCGGSYDWCYAGCCTKCVTDSTPTATPTNVPGCKDKGDSCFSGTCCSGLTCQGTGTGKTCKVSDPDPTSAPTVKPDGCKGGGCITSAPTSTPTPTRTPTPSPTPREGEITGRVYNVANDKAIKGLAIGVRHKSSDPWEYDYSSSTGRYSIGGLASGAKFEVRAFFVDEPTYWSFVVPNSTGRYTDVSPGSTRDFGIATEPTPTPTPTPVPYVIDGLVFVDTDGNGIRNPRESGLNGVQISVSKPTGTTCNGLRNWGPKSTGRFFGGDPQGGEFEFDNLCAGTYTVTIGSIPNGYQVISATTQTVTLTTGLRTATVRFAVGQTRTITGTLRVDNDGPDCGATGSNPYNGGGTARLFSGVAEVDSETIAVGAYSLTTTRTGNNFHVVFSGLSGYAPTAYRLNGGACTPISGFDLGPFDIPPNTNSLEVFVSNTSSWYQVGSGDVRMMAIQNLIPSGQYGSIGNPTAIFYSSTFPALFGQGNSSSGASNRWVVSNEYGANSVSEARRGTVSYSYFAHQVEAQGIDAVELCSGSCTQDISALATGAYTVNGDLTINSYSHASGRRVTLLVDGNIFLNSNVIVPQGGLLFMLASGDIVFGPTVGTSSLSSQTPSVDGIYSAERNIVIDGTGCSGGVSDLRLNVGGVLISNSLQPFSRDGGGVVDNRRSLCGDNINYPTYAVFPRYDYLFQLTDFYKVAAEEWREVAP